MKHWIAFSLAGLLLLTSSLRAQKADEDFAIQGEYVGDADTQDGKVKVGAQVIALGDHKFQVAGYFGGLPGDGWKPETQVGHAEGTLDNGSVTFTENKVTATLKDGVMTVSNDGNPFATLKKVTRKSPTLGAKPPAGAKVLFAGKDQNDFPADKVSSDGLLMQGVASKTKVQSCTLHLEFLLPFEPKGRGQGRANSGCYLQGRYEVQILDSFGLEGKDNECGGIYTISAPAVNMCFPPMSWQTYDIDFTAAEFDATGKKIKNARMTVKHNGVLIQDNVEVPHDTTAAPNKEGPEAGPIYLQDHGHPVRFQNVWLVEKK
ncbi:MAG: DUF1080 domain-containing protein [Bacillota bacterium]